MMKTRSLMMKKCRNMKNEIKTRWGDSINFLYCSHIINKSRRSHGQCQIKVHFVKRRVKASFGKLGVHPEYKQFIMCSGDGKDGKLTFGSSVLAS